MRAGFGAAHPAARAYEESVRMFRALFLFLALKCLFSV